MTEVSEVTLRAEEKRLGFLYVMGWLALDAGFRAKQPTSAQDRLTLAQNCENCCD